MKREFKKAAIAFGSIEVGPSFDRLRSDPFSRDELDELYSKLKQRASRKASGRLTRKFNNDNLEPSFVARVEQLFTRGYEKECLVLLRWENSYISCSGSIKVWAQKAFGRNLIEDSHEEVVVFSELIYRNLLDLTERKVKVEPGMPASVPIAFHNAMVGVSYVKLQCRPFDAKEFETLRRQLEGFASRKRHNRVTRLSKRCEINIQFCNRVKHFIDANMRNEALVLMRWGFFWYDSVVKRGPKLTRERHGQEPFHIRHQRAFGSQDSDEVREIPHKIDISKIIRHVIDLTVAEDIPIPVKQPAMKVKDEPCG